MKELIEKYHVDGVWTDGECWSTLPDYQPAALEEFVKRIGIAEVPRSKDDPNYKTFLEFNRKKFISYLDYYVNELHRFSPDFQICSNRAFSSLMPEPVIVDLDFLSGDFSPNNPVNTAAWQSRCLAGQGKHIGIERTKEIGFKVVLNLFYPDIKGLKEGCIRHPLIYVTFWF